MCDARRPSELPDGRQPTVQSTCLLMSRAFQKLKDALAEAALLAHPIPNSRLSIILDASTTAAGAVLHQQCGTERQPLAFFSKTFSPAEHRYNTFGRELLTVYFAVRHFKHYVEGSHVVVSPLLCDTSTGEPRPIVPPAYRRTVFKALHGLAHPDVKASVTLIASRFS